MRLDKFVGKASYSLKIRVFDWKEGKLLFFIGSGEDYNDKIRKEMSTYKVNFYNIENDCLAIYVKEKFNG